MKQSNAVDLRRHHAYYDVTIMVTGEYFDTTFTDTFSQGPN